MNIELSSPKYRVLSIKRKSNARYAKGVQIGDIFTFKSVMKPVKYGVRYTLLFDVFVNNILIATEVSHGEISKIFLDDNGIFVVDVV